MRGSVAFDGGWVDLCGRCTELKFFGTASGMIGWGGCVWLVGRGGMAGCGDSRFLECGEIYLIM